MKAAVQHRYGPPDAVTIQDMPKPVPRDDEVLVRVHAAVLGVVDGLARRGAPFYARSHFGLRRPRLPVLGCDFAGQVEAAGPAVTEFAAGQDVFGTIAPRFGAHAEYVCLPAHAAIAPKPANLTYAEAAALVDATALCFLRDKARLQRGQSVLVNGASGAVGAAAVQLARHFGATVTAVCSGAHAELAAKLGAQRVLDYTAADFATAGQTYDVVFDVAGTSSFARCRAVLNRPGCYLTTAPSLAVLVQMPWTARFGARRAVVAFTGLRPAGEKRKDLALIKELAEESRLLPVIEACYPLEQIADAHRRVDAGHKAGNVLVTVTGQL
ncbi:MAG TPA: NAD(P)-dependent alcohol dehydrogenase [Streptosporangiaceae bacterium]|nr:NAD(P)-dependent alcohol dehydrogenase [Streptosporangiaceae bacterium]